MIELTINNKKQLVKADESTPLLWVLRDHLNLNGSKFGCGRGLCGACTVHVNNKPIRSCITLASQVVGKQVTTIEGVSNSGNHPVQRAWKSLNVSQCGYCQSGQIMSAIALLNSNSSPSSEEINTAMSGNLCRCGTYNRIKKAIYSASKELNVRNFDNSFNKN